MPYKPGAALPQSLGTSSNPTFGVVTVGGITIGSAAITEAELEIIDGATVSTAEINQLNAIPRGNLIYGNASAATARLTPGSDGQVLTSDGTDISWQNAAGGGGGSAADDESAILHAITLGF